MDLNMLASDFYVMATSSRKGSKFDDYFSKTHGEMVLQYADPTELTGSGTLIDGS